jgi:hypothetical protein
MDLTLFSGNERNLVVLTGNAQFAPAQEGTISSTDLFFGE